MELKDLAPWIAIAFTLALSILVPLFTQIANNRHQRKMQREKFEYEQRQKKIIAYENFMKEVGAVITRFNNENWPAAGSSIAQMYIYAPTAWMEDLDHLLCYVGERNWDAAGTIFRRLCRLIADDLNMNAE